MTSGLEGAALSGHVALITGGGGGLGRQAALTLGSQGAAVVLADVDKERLETVVQWLATEGVTAEARVVDVCASGSVDQAVDEVLARHGRLDVVLTSHGFPKDARLVDMSDADWASVIDVCLTGTFYTLRSAARPMIEAGYGRIITLASRAWHGNPGQANYSAAKAGVVGLTRSVAKELGRYGITANSLAPGLVDTESLRKLPTFESIQDRAIKASSIKRLGTADDVAGAVAFLASPTSGFITGEVIHVSGGRFA
ncbi:SDR family oxidoreductase [Modestobacter excelsi]|uniref:SDR family oxidoreductase n=1 Tax=Modestobacter excelsi TaxID=2213161 RepID=UPI00110CF0FD|nr:SDR family NAD(P)-dependent oxidoreductase [Modestobacter excelsi]